MSLPTEYLKQFGRFQGNAQLYLISTALSGVSTGIVLVLYNLYLQSLGYGTDFIGLILFVGTIAAGLTIFPAGICVDHFGGKSILIWASVLIAAAGTGQILLPMPIPLLVSTFVAGVGGAFILVVTVPFLTAHSMPAERSQLFSLNIVVTLVTIVLGEALGGILPLWLRSIPQLMTPPAPRYEWVLIHNPEARSYQLALLFAGIIALPSFIPLLLMKDDRPKDTAESAPAVSLPRLHRPSVGRIHLFLPSGTASARPLSHLRGLATHTKSLAVLAWRRKSYIHAICSSSLFALIAMQALTGLGAGLFIPYFNIYFVRHLGASSALFGVIDGCANLLNALLTLLAPWLALRIGKVGAILLPRALSLPVMLVIGLTDSLPLAAMLYPLRQGLMDMPQGILQAFFMEAVSQEHRGLANSSYQAAFLVAWACGAPIGGLIIAHQGYVPVFLCAAILYFLALAVIWLRFGRRNGKHSLPHDMPDASGQQYCL